MDEKLKSENMQKEQFSMIMLAYILRAIRAGMCVDNGDMLTTYLFRYIPVLQNAPFRSQIFFASGGKGALTPPQAKSCGRSCLRPYHEHEPSF